jgi:hypothetical protein
MIGDSALIRIIIWIRIITVSFSVLSALFYSYMFINKRSRQQIHSNINNIRSFFLIVFLIFSNTSLFQSSCFTHRCLDGEREESVFNHGNYGGKFKGMDYG